MLTHPPNSQGFLLLEILRVLEELAVAPDALGKRAGTVAEVFVVASDDRDRYLADPRRVSVPVDDLLSVRHAQKLPAKVRAQHGGVRGDRSVASVPSSRGHDRSCCGGCRRPRGLRDPERVPQLRGPASSSRGRASCVTTGGQASAWIPARPTYWRKASALPHTLMPVMATSAGRGWIAAGTMGGRAQPQIHVHVLGRLFVGGLDLPRALEAPRWVVGALDAGQPTQAVFAEHGALKACGDSLEASGLPVIERRGLDEAVGHAQCVLVRDDGQLEAASDPRADGEGGAR